MIFNKSSFPVQIAKLLPHRNVLKDDRFCRDLLAVCLPPNLKLVSDCEQANFSQKIVNCVSLIQKIYKSELLAMDTVDLFENSVNEGEEFEEELTAAEVLQKLEDAWLNEKHSPELLEPKMEIVECMMEQVATMEENLSRLKKGDLRIPVHR